MWTASRDLFMIPSRPTMLLATHHIDLQFWGFFVVWWTLWFLLNYYIGKGWRSFAARFGTTVRPSGAAYFARDAWFPRTNYRNLRVILTDTGIYFPRGMLRLFHPPFLVPWNRVIEIKKRQGFSKEWYKLQIEDSFEKISLTLPASAGPDLSRHCKVT